MKKIFVPESMKKTKITGMHRLTLFAICILALLVPGCSALYAFDGFPLTTVSQGEVNGHVLQYSIMGLDNPPQTLAFDIPEGSEIQWARTYVGVWGGTPRYTGWVQLVANDKTFDKITLYGQDDKTQNVWCTGYGVYWIAWDTRSNLKTGHNTVTATTSQGEANSKLDGRIYGVMTVVVLKDSSGTDTKYSIMEGNVNLHGTGWTAGANPTVNDQTSATFSVPDTTGFTHANLTVVELTSTRGLPDYVQFNGKDLGPEATGTDYVAGEKDIANERSYDDGYTNPNGAPATIMSRYWDAEIFDVTSLLKTGSNELVFLRGKDMNGDGEISSTGEKAEGEDYLHPVFAMLTLEKAGSSGSAGSAETSSGSTSVSSGSTDLSIGQIEVTNAYNGETADITATLQNLGTRPTSTVSVVFSVDGSQLATKQVTVDPSGVQAVSVSWPATTGTHTITAEVQATGDTVTSNDAMTKEITIGSLPDLAVTVGAPHRPGSSTEQTKSPLPVWPVAFAIIAVVSVFGLRRYPPNGGRKLASLFMVGILLTAWVPVLAPVASAADSTNLYLLPVTIKNAGGSDASSFTLTVYLDGEKIATKSCDDGLGAGKELSADIPIHTTAGIHQLKVVADEAGAIRETDRSNNLVEGSYEFF